MLTSHNNCFHDRSAYGGYAQTSFSKTRRNDKPKDAENENNALLMDENHVQNGVYDDIPLGASTSQPQIMANYMKNSLSDDNSLV